MQNTTRYVLLSLLTLILIILFTPVFSYILVTIFGRADSGLASINIGVIIETMAGFLLSYLFFIPFMLTIFFPKPQKYYATFSLIGLVALISLPQLGGFIIYFVPIALCGWLLGEGILWLYNKLKK